MRAAEKYRTIFVALTAAVLVSCHTETPAGIDSTDPAAELMFLYNDTDTLYNYADTTGAFTDFSYSILEKVHNVKFSADDKGGLFRASLVATDKYTEERYIIRSTENVSNGENEISFGYKEFPAVQDSSPQEFYLSILIEDESENHTETKKAGFNVLKVYPFDLFYDALGILVEIEGDSVDFREKNGKLAFIQFMSKGCLSCVEEAREMKAMYADTLNYDLSKYSHSLFGSYFTDEADFRSFKTREEKLPFDCFLDNGHAVKAVFETISGETIENEVFAVLPNGKIKKYNYLEVGFTEWAHSMYAEAYPNKNTGK